MQVALVIFPIIVIYLSEDAWKTDKIIFTIMLFVTHDFLFVAALECMDRFTRYWPMTMSNSTMFGTEWTNVTY